MGVTAAICALARPSFRRDPAPSSSGGWPRRFRDPWRTCAASAGYHSSVLRVGQVVRRTPRRRRFGFLVLICAALLLTLLALHSGEHGIEEGAVLTCAVVVVAGAVALRSSTERPPFLPAVTGFVTALPVQPVVVAAPRATESPPGFIPLRL